MTVIQTLYWDNMTTEVDSESCAFSLNRGNKELGHVFSEDGDGWRAFLGDSGGTEFIGWYKTRGGAKRALRAAVKKEIGD